MATWRCKCGVSNHPAVTACEGCGDGRPVRRPPEAEAPAGGMPTVCALDGAPLDASGWCREGGGWPLTLRCPFFCPVCRARLGWDGGCLRCFGTVTPADRETWQFPGDEYQLDEATRHYVRVGGPSPVASRATVTASVAEFQARLAAILRRRVPGRSARRADSETV